MNVTREQIEGEFRRQVKLCRDIGYPRMQEIIAEVRAEEYRLLGIPDDDAASGGR